MVTFGHQRHIIVTVTPTASTSAQPQQTQRLLPASPTIVSVAYPFARCCIHGKWFHHAQQGNEDIRKRVVPIIGTTLVAL